MKLTPRQIAAFLQFSDVEQAHQLVMRAIAAQGDDKIIEKTRRELNGRALQGHR
jgi:hypothetical protein